MTTVSTLLYVAVIFGCCIGLAFWRQYGWTRAVVWVLYAVANRAIALAAAADHARLVYHERMAPRAVETMTPEPVVRAAREGTLSPEVIHARRP